MPQTHLKISQAETRQFIFSALAVFLIAFLTIALWANWTLQRDGEQLLMEQQKSLVSVVAFQSNTEFNDRLGHWNWSRLRLTPTCLVSLKSWRVF